MSEKGFILFNNLISLSIILVLLSTIGVIIFWTLQKGKEIRGDFELLRELSYSMERITEDANLADRVKLDHTVTGDIIFIEYKTKPKNTFERVSYGKMDAPNGRLARMIVDSPTAPMTGDSEIGNVHITNFKTKKVSEHLILVELEGMSRVTNHIYTLKTAIYVQGEILE